jgi:thioesterase domain-containing protein
MMDLWPEENTRRKWLFFPYVQTRSVLAMLTGRSASGPLSALKRKLSGSARQPAAPAPASTPVAEVAPRSRWELYWPGPDFKPPVFSGKITVFKVKRQLIYRTRDKTLGWGCRALGSVDVELIPGDHETFLREPHVKVVAEKIAERITQPVPALAGR